MSDIESPDSATVKRPWEAAPFSEIFRCPESQEPLRFDRNSFVSRSGRRWPVIRGIPRFVPGDLYAASFSYEWNVHSRTQLDSHTGADSSEEMLRRKTGLTPEQVRGKLVLDAGVGAGRFSDVLLQWGGRVVGVDLSYAVEAAHRNFGDNPNAVLAQADIGRLPFAPETFDLVISIGVLHHTPSTRAHFEKLIPLLKPGGTICIWVYPPEHDYLLRVSWIPFTSRIPKKWFHCWCKVYVPYAHRHPERALVQYLWRHFPMSNQHLGVENDVLDTFDGYSPRYHWIHSPEEVRSWFEELQFEDIQVFPWNTAVRGRRKRR